MNLSKALVDINAGIFIVSLLEALIAVATVRTDSVDTVRMRRTCVKLLIKTLVNVLTTPSVADETLLAFAAVTFRGIAGLGAD